MPFFQIFELMFTKLTEVKTDFAERLLFSLKRRIIERRHKVISTLLAYLEKPNFLNTTRGKHLEYANKDEIANEAARIFVRLYGTNVEESQVDDDPDDPDSVTETEEVEAVPPKRTDSDDFKDVVKDDKPAPQVSGSVTITPLEIIQRAMSEYEISGERPSSLEKVNCWQRKSQRDSQREFQQTEWRR